MWMPWDDLPAPMRAALQLAWTSAGAGSLGIGAVVTRADGEIVATGRNRLMEQDPGDDVLAGSSLAHAELNALAKLPFRGHGDDELTLWTTLQPCIQCLGAIRLSQIEHVRVLAPDPIFRGIERIRESNAFVGARWPAIDEHDVDEWSVLALLLPSRGERRGVVEEIWTAALPRLCATVRELEAAGELDRVFADHPDVESAAAGWLPRLSECVDEVAALAAATTV